MTEVDLVVIGTGPGGESLATKAATSGLRVVAVEKHLVGGECPYYACIPTKVMVRGSDAIAEARRLPAIGGAATVEPSWSVVARRIAEDATDHWDDRAAVERLEKAGATVHHGTGRLTGLRQVAVTLADGSVVEYDAAVGVVLNIGTRPSLPPAEGLADTPYWTNRDIVKVDSVPGSLVVLGGGPIGCELAQVFARFGARVTVLQYADRLLDHDEPEASQALHDAFVHEGIRVLTGTSATRVDHTDGTFTITTDAEETLTAEKLLVAAGRTPNLDDLGLETVGLDPKGVEVDEHLRAGDGLWLIGDAAGQGAFTHVSMYQADVALRDILGEQGEPASYHAIPHVTFTDPEVAGVGLTEAAAREKGITVKVGTTDLAESSRGFLHGPGAAGNVKVVADADREILVGASVTGPAAGEIIGLLVLAVHARIPIAQLRSMIYAYPTFHRAIESALVDLSH
ncbi:dihydrolipoyl dehydrogenase family protein [Nocardioides sp. Kera G14]|uniref:dihydrolipoyl dehydrogenase family protein n=1 Tax=Nocardioides sp. Kera G14 TaxID=2884264 RepID=UPI001D109832|nr:NAD(P)/FAD-dependent oxidoreductase [Nocardioides sp. Kera G14]UDY22156.1 NAD(P)/FAD-dependent oxidoreductase [Nocardioides sp. Kera G14]